MTYIINQKPIAHELFIVIMYTNLLEWALRTGLLDKALQMGSQVVTVHKDGKLVDNLHVHVAMITKGA